MIVFAPHSWGLSHVGRSLLVAEELQRRGRACVFVGDGPFVLPADSLVRQKGIAVRELVDMPMEAVLVNGFDFHTAESLRRLVEAERAMIRELRPSVIVSDYRPSIHVAAAIEKVPVVALTNIHWTHHWATAITPPIEHPITVKATRLLGRPLAMALLSRLTPLIAQGIFKKNVRLYNELLAEHGLPPHRDILDFFEGSAATYLTDAPEWCALKTPLPEKVRVAGPLYWAPEPAPGWEEGLPTDKPWIYLSAGSSANPEVFPALFRELAGLPYRVIMTTAGLPLPEGVPENFTVREFLPGEPMMAKSALSILNGGSGTIYQGLMARAPMLLVPMRGDQEWNARDAEQAGLAEAVHCRHVVDEPGRLRRTAEAILADSARRKAALDALATKLERYEAAKAIADGIERIAPAMSQEAAS